MNVAIVSSNPARRDWLGAVVVRLGHDVSLASERDTLPDDVCLTVLDIAPERALGGSFDAATLQKAVAGCRRLRGRPGGEQGALLLVGSDPALAPAAFAELLEAGADDYLALPSGGTPDEPALARGIVAVERRHGRAEQLAHDIEVRDT